MRNISDYLSYMSPAYWPLSDQQVNILANRGFSPGKHEAPSLSSKLLLGPGPKGGEMQPVIGLEAYRDCRCRHFCTSETALMTTLVCS